MAHHPRPPYLVAAFGLLGLALLVRVSFRWTLAGLVSPDLVFVGAVVARPTAPGLMPRALVRPYNTTYHPVTALALLAASTVTGLRTLALALAWGAHICWDRGIGYDLRLPDGSIRDPRRPVVRV